MLLSDGEIRGLIRDGVLVDATEGNVGVVTYDLRTKGFVGPNGAESSGCRLDPGDSAFVRCVEGVRLPADLAARVLLRNSRIRQGLTLDAPLYFPGHGTVLYYRVTNVSGSAIDLDCADGIAQVEFERVEEPVEHRYDGAFQGEVSFRGMGSYRDAYSGEMSQLQDKVDEVKGIERRMYGNVMTIMAILAGVFTLVNVNVGAVGGTAQSVVVTNLVTVGSFAALSALIGELFEGSHRRTAVGSRGNQIRRLPAPSPLRRGRVVVSRRPRTGAPGKPGIRCRPCRTTWACRSAWPSPGSRRGCGP